MTTELTPPRWHGVYVQPGQCGIHVDVMEELGAELLVVGPELAAQWVSRNDVVPSMTFRAGTVMKTGSPEDVDGEPPKPQGRPPLPFMPFTWGGGWRK